MRVRACVYHIDVYSHDYLVCTSASSLLAPAIMQIALRTARREVASRLLRGTRARAGARALCTRIALHQTEWTVVDQFGMLHSVYVRPVTSKVLA